ncbi:hypothetical protein [Desulfothermus sp.]
MRKIGLFLGILIFVCFNAMAEEWQPVTDPVKVFSQGYIQVIGASEEGQSRYRAIRAATVVAQRDLLEVLQGITLYGTTTVRDGMLQSDNIRTTVQGVLKGAIKCGEKYYPNRGYAEVCLRLYLRGHGGLYDVILPLLKDEGMLPPPKPVYQPKLIPQVMEKPKPTTQTQPVQPKPEVITPSKIENPYDGVIVDVREYPFRPALVNRILNENGEIIFDPSKIVSSVLVERGCGGFTNNEDKAIALLKTWGSKNPLKIKAVKVIKNTDVAVNKDDSALIFVNNEKTQFLNQARVVFLLK